MNYYICNYSDYTDLPDVLFDGNTPSKERSSTNGLMFVARSASVAGHLDLSWMAGDETPMTYSEILGELSGEAWNVID